MSNVLVEETHSLTKGYTKALDLKHGGQQGPLSDPEHWVSSAEYVRQKMIAVLVEAPKFMTYMTDGPDRIAMLKSMVEVMATNITGINNKLDVSFSDNKVSNAGEVHSTPTQVVREVSAPVFEWPEKRGKAIFKFNSDWIIELIADPETTHPGLITKDAYEAAGFPEFLPDSMAMTVLFFEPSDDLHTVTEAALCTNMMPKTSGESTMTRAIGEANETVKHSIEYTSTTHRSDAVLQLAKDYLEALNVQGYRPAGLAAYYDSIGSDVIAVDEDYASKVANVAAAS